jgi:hypothetical protein
VIRELEQHLRQAPAPDELWERIANPRARQRTRRSRVPLLLAVAAAALAATVVWSRGSRDLELRSNVAGEIRDWVRNRTGLDIPFPDATPPDIWLAGVCEVKGGSPTVKVSYRVSGRNAELLVSKAPADSGEGRHQSLKCESVGRNRVSSWTMRGQHYTLAFAAAGDARDECRLCHNGPGQEHLTLSN